MTAAKTLLNNSDMQVLATLWRENRPLSTREVSDKLGVETTTHVCVAFTLLETIGMCKLSKGRPAIATLLEKGALTAKAYEDAAEYIGKLSQDKLRKFLATYQKFGHGWFSIADCAKTESGREAYRIYLHHVVKIGWAELQHNYVRLFRYNFEALTAYGLLSNPHLEPYIKALPPTRILLIAALLKAQREQTALELSTACHTNPTVIYRDSAKDKSGVVVVNKSVKPARFSVDTKALFANSNLLAQLAEAGFGNLLARVQKEQR